MANQDPSPVYFFSEEDLRTLRKECQGTPYGEEMRKAATAAAHCTCFLLFFVASLMPPFKQPGPLSSGLSFALLAVVVAAGHKAATAIGRAWGPVVDLETYGGGKLLVPIKKEGEQLLTIPLKRGTRQRELLRMLENAFAERNGIKNGSRPVP